MRKKEGRTEGRKREDKNGLVVTVVVVFVLIVTPKVCKQYLTRIPQERRSEHGTN